MLYNIPLCRRSCAFAVVSLRASVHNHTYLAARRHTPCMHLLWRRQQSAHAAIRVRDTQNSEAAVAGVSATPNGERSPPFAVEQVDGRARHLIWSASGGVHKEWRELAVADSDTGKAVVPAKSSRSGRVISWLRQMFLPTNYPHSVHKS